MPANNRYWQIYLSNKRHWQKIIIDIVKYFILFTRKGMQTQSIFVAEQTKKAAHRINFFFFFLFSSIRASHFGSKSVPVNGSFYYWMWKSKVEREKIFLLMLLCDLNKHKASVCKQNKCLTRIDKEFTHTILFFLFLCFVYLFMYLLLFLVIGLYTLNTWQFNKYYFAKILLMPIIALMPNKADIIEVSTMFSLKEI